MVDETWVEREDFARDGTHEQTRKIAPRAKGCRMCASERRVKRRSAERCGGGRREGGGVVGRAVDTRCKSGLLDDAAAGVVREGRGGDAPLSLLPRLSVVVTLVMARRPRAPGLLVLQGVVARPLPEALEETLLLGRVAAFRAGVRTGRRVVVLVLPVLAPASFLDEQASDPP